MVLVRFLRSWRMFNDGEVAGWQPAFATYLVDEKKVARYLTDEELGIKPDALADVDASEPESGATTVEQPAEKPIEVILEEMDVPALRVLAKDNNVELHPRWRKDKIIEVLAVTLKGQSNA